MDDMIIYRKTDKGVAEMQSDSPALERGLRRALILIDGSRDIAELSVLMRPGEAHDAVTRLVVGGYIAPVDAHEIPSNRVAMMPYASVPENFERIKLAATLEMSAKLGAFAPTVIAEIETCQTALDFRAKLRDIEDMLIAAIGEEEGRGMAQHIGRELTRLVPRNNLGVTQRLRTILE
jgi:hypothetical protein